MIRFFFGTLFLALVFVLPDPTMARVDVGISISLPPPIVFAGPLELVVIPETYVYAVPDAEVDIFFYGGWWWRPWQGRWYRSRYYNSGWAHYQSVPLFYSSVPLSWRNDYRNRRWAGHQWNYRRIPQQQLQRNWNRWEKNRYWERNQTWGVQGLNPRSRSRDVRQPDNRPQAQPVRQQTREVAPRVRDDRPQDYRPQSRRDEPRQVRQKQQVEPRQARPRQERPEQGGGERQEKR
jgi:hypothetical protein